MQFGQILIGLVIGFLAGIIYKIISQGKDRQTIASLKERESISSKRITELKQTSQQASKDKESLHANLATAQTEKANLMEKLETQEVINQI